ncbi:MAG: 16S rRNA (adenine(1518)-N(6)/adenine(1519)-N(6))-dimethyltransferase RsmA [Aeriscardovia sp.]|nr:16S rRNA (adenine(1518)-N(6)/adenine(1519)-N(6))-dimethyltransferase RsmA [Aeriscardovia sp.]
MSSIPGAAWIKSKASQLGVVPSKSLGQNFMTDPHFLSHIASLAPTGSNRVLEVGPGLGSLTLPLLERGFEVKAVELDSRLASALPETIKELFPESLGRFSCIHKDALKLEPEDLKWGEEFSLVSNLPYSVSVPVVLHLLSHFPCLSSFLVLVQKEVGERMCAEKGNKIYGAPTLKLAWYGKAKIVEKVPRTVFWPSPHVDSVLVEFKREATPQELREKTFFLIDKAFSTRRKTLKNSLSFLDKSLLEEAGIDLSLRPENLSVKDFKSIAALLS